MVFVRILDDGNDSFYVLRWKALRDLLVSHYVGYLAKHSGIRPKKWDSLHCAVTEQKLMPYQDKWDAIEKSLK